MKNKQKGAGLIAWVFVLAMIGFIALLAIRVLPPYMEYLTVSSVVQSLKDDPDLRGAQRLAVLSALDKRFQINDVKSVERDDITTEQVSEGLQVVVEYENRFPLLGNFDGVATFREQVIIPR